MAGDVLITTSGSSGDNSVPTHSCRMCPTSSDKRRRLNRRNWRIPVEDPQSLAAKAACGESPTWSVASARRSMPHSLGNLTGAVGSNASSDQPCQKPHPRLED